MVKNGKELGEDSMYGSALVEFGESLHQMADVKYALEDNVKQNFLDPLYNLQNKDLREVCSLVINNLVRGMSPRLVFVLSVKLSTLMTFV